MYLDVGHAHHATAVVHVHLEVHLHILKDEGEGTRGVDDVMEGDYVGMFEVLEQRDLSDGSAGGTFLMLQSNLLQGNKLTSDTAGGREGST